MIQIIEENRRPQAPKKPTMQDRFKNAFDVAVDVGTKTWLGENERKIAEERENKENEFARRLFGEDISGLKDPKSRQEYFAERLRGQNQEKKSQFDAFIQSQRDKQKFENEKTLKYDQYRFQKDRDIQNFHDKYELMNQKHQLNQELSNSKGNKKQIDEKEVRDIGQKSFNGIVKILNKGNVGYGSGIMSKFGGETAEDIGQFTSLTGGLEAMLVDMVSRGALSDSRFKYITETLLPKPTDNQSEIKGKLKGLAEILNLDISELTGGKSKILKASSFWE